MKIEIAESVFYSWLRHIKQCQIVQNNWKVSPSWKVDDARSIEVKDYLTDFNNEIILFYKNTFGHNTQGILKASTPDQFIKQGEADALGINYADGNIPNVYAIDVAFHSAGLQYGDKYTTAIKVIEKCFRTAMCLHLYLGKINGTIIFASPKINDATLDILNPCFDFLKSYFLKQKLSFSFELINDVSFKGTILLPLLNIGSDISDTNELFMRSSLLLDMFGLCYPSTCAVVPTKARVPSPSSAISVGYIVKTELRGIIEQLLPSDPTISKLQDPIYCKKEFGTRLPVLVEEGTFYESSRYYVDSINIGSKQYKLTNDWYEKNRQKLNLWVEEHKLTN